MGVEIGKLTITGQIDDLKRNSIYCIDSLHEKIKNRTPLDYDFLLIDGKRHTNGNHQCIFITAIECIFNNDKPSKDLNETIIGELGSVTWDTGDDKKEMGPEDQKHIFKWLSRILERLPGRIFIVGAEEPDGWEEISKKKNLSRDGLSEDEQIKLWLTRRIVWIGDIKSKLDSLKIEYRLDGKAEPSSAIKEVKDNDGISPSLFQNFLWSAWLNHLSTDSDFEMDVIFGNESPKIARMDVKNNLKRWVFKYYDILKNGSNHSLEAFEILLLIPFDYHLPKESDSLAKLFKEYLEERKAKRINNSSLSAEFKQFLKAKNRVYKRQDSIKLAYFEEVIRFFSLAKQDKITEPTVAPQTFLKKPFVFADSINLSIKEINGFKVIFTPPGEEKSEKQERNKILYFRHGTKRSEFVKEMKNRKIKNESDKEYYYYYETMTGAAFHYQLIYSGLNWDNDEKRLMTLINLAENGLLKMVVADERIANFVDSDEKKKQFDHCGIKVLKNIDGIGGIAGIHDFTENGSVLQTFKDIETDAVMGSYDVLLIHQGILDKIKNSNQNFNEEIINKWKLEYFPYIIVTSGRGIPENVPINCKFLPFSNIETTLISNPPSKFLLTKMIFKILSSKKESKNDKKQSL